MTNQPAGKWSDVEPSEAVAMMSSRIAKFAGIWVGIFVVLSGCSPIPYIVLKNDSGVALTIVSDGETHTAAIADVIKFVYPGNTHNLIVSIPTSERRTYEVTDPGDRYFYKDTMFVQIEADGRIYVLESKLGLTSKPAHQPGGFPWTPVPK